MEVALTPAAKRILYLIPIADWGGSQRYVFDMALASMHAGYEVMVATGHGKLPEKLKAAGIPVTEFASFTRGLNASAEGSFLFDAVRMMREFRPDIVHANNSKGGLVGALAARLALVERVVFTAHGWAFTEARPWWQRAVFWLGHYATVLLSDVTICVSENIYQLGCRMPFAKGKLKVIHNGVPPIELRSREDARAALAPDISAPLWIGTFAELHPNKGLDILIEAFEHALPDVPDMALVIVGDGQLREQLARQAELEGVKGRVRLAGHKDNAAQYARAFDIFTLTSRTEALGYALLEAGSAGLACVGTRVGGIPEIIEDKHTGLLVPYGDREALTDALVTLARNEKLRAGLGYTLHAKVEAEFSQARMVRETLALY